MVELNDEKLSDNSHLLNFQYLQILSQLINKLMSHQDYISLNFLLIPLDLVLVSDKADPPVCRIMDYGKYKFEQEKKAREARKKQHTADVKEVKMRYKIDDHDYRVRVNHAERFLKSGDKVKATITFRGREIQHSNLAEELLKRMAVDLQDIAEVQQAPKREGRNMMMLLSPKK
nr:translation initiation factor IF-3 [Okeania sp. SIO2C9]